MNIRFKMTNIWTGNTIYFEKVFPSIYRADRYTSRLLCQKNNPYIVTIDFDSLKDGE